MERQERTHQKCRSFPKYLVRSCEIEEGLVPFALDMSGSLVRGWNSGYFYWLLAKFPFVLVQLVVPLCDDV